MAYIYDTECCALAGLRASGLETEKAIRHGIEAEIREGGSKAIFCVAISYETYLIENLKKIGFKRIATFPRRDDHNQAHHLIMYLLKADEYIPEAKPKKRSKKKSTTQ